MIQIHYGVFYIAALLLFLLPLDWLLAFLIASICHELMHVLALYCLKGKILKIKVQPGGCSIETGRLGEWRQFFSILAGPIGSLSLLLLCHTAPKIAICGFFQGLYNLIPVLPLDGGRLLRLLLYQICPRQAEPVMNNVAVGTCVVLDALVIWLSRMVSFGPWLLTYAFLWNIKILQRKIPCKQSEIGVQ